MKINEMLNAKGRIHWYSAVLLTILFFNIGILLSPEYQSTNFIIKYSFYLLAIISTFFIFYLKKGSKVRWGLFSFMALLMPLWFMTSFFIERGHIGLTEANMIEEGIPFCHIAIVNNLMSVPIIKTFISPGALVGNRAAIYPMILIWLWATILIGKGWCSWGCFYGGWDSFFSKLTKKPLVKISEAMSKKLRIIPFAILIVVAFLSLILMYPVQCGYICPFKTITEFQHVTTFKTWIIFVVTAGGFIGFTILMPIFFGRRIWCTYLCPFGALQSITGKVFRVFKLKINKDKCIDCKICVNTCKTAGITESSLEKKKFTNNCSLCGLCIDACPKNAIEVSCFGSTKTPKNLLVKLTEKLSNIKILKNIINFIINIIDDVLNPQTFLYFFGLAVLFTFLSGFYFDAIDSITKLIIGG